MVTDSILSSIKTLLGIESDVTDFDQELILHINGALSIIHQIGLEEANNFFIEDDTAVWGDFINDDANISFIKTYVYNRVKLSFDTPQNSFLVKAIEDQIRELEWRLNISVDIVPESV
jgi:hypothetical protein